MKWNDIEDVRPDYGQNVYYKGRDDDDMHAVPGTYERERWCMIGKPNGSCGEGFQDDYNKLPALDNADLWVDAIDFEAPEGYRHDQ